MAGSGWAGPGTPSIYRRRAAWHQRRWGPLVAPVARQFVKLVGGYAKTHFDFSFSNMVPYDDDMFSVRLRLMYLY